MKATKLVVRPLMAVSFGVVLPLLIGAAGCKKTEAPVVPDAAPVAVVVPDAAPVDLSLSTTDDAGLDAGIDAALPHHPSAGGGTNVARIKACCTAIRSQAKSLGASPEANVLTGVATQCDAVAAQAGTSGTAPELAALRSMLKGHTLPSVCQ